MTPEGKVKQALKLMLKKYTADVYVFMPVQAGYGAPGLDFHCVVHDRAFFVETKAPGGALTKRQMSTIKHLQKIGSTVFVLSNIAGIDALEKWLCKTISESSRNTER
jgi:hypothetical protein